MKRSPDKSQRTLAGFLICCFLSGCAHTDKDAATLDFSMGPTTHGGVTYYPAHPGTTNYNTVEYTTNPPPAGVRPFVVVVSTNARVNVKFTDGTPPEFRPGGTN